MLRGTGHEVIDFGDGQPKPDDDYPGSVHLRKPDAEIFRPGLDIAQAPASRVLYIENTPMFVQIAESFGIRSVLDTDYRSHARKSGFRRLAE
jgi:FMN phosphatase YigB (HAD superfamily)